VARADFAGEELPAILALRTWTNVGDEQFDTDSIRQHPHAKSAMALDGKYERRLVQTKSARCGHVESAVEYRRLIGFCMRKTPRWAAG
jgi:hypothetical protein